MAIVPFTDATGKGLVGQHANSEEWNAITRLADNVATTPIGFGQPVMRHNSDPMVCRAWADGNAVLGITRYRVDVDGVTGYAEGGNVSIMTMGVMKVAAGSTATAGARAGYDPTGDRWANVGGDYKLIAGVEFDTSAGSDGGIVNIRINRPTTSS